MILQHSISRITWCEVLFMVLGLFKLDCAESVKLTDTQARRTKDLLNDNDVLEFPKEGISHRKLTFS